MYSQLQRTNLVLYSILTKGALSAYVHNACIEIFKNKLHGWFKCNYYQTWSEPAGTEVGTHTRVHCHKKKVRHGPFA